MIYQVTITDKQDFIIEYKNFTLGDMKEMLDYIALRCARFYTIKITCWKNGVRQ